MLYLSIMSVKQIRDQLPTAARVRVQTGSLAKVGYQLVPRPPGGADGAHERPVFVGLPVADAAVAAKEHARNMGRPPPGNGVFYTTRPFRSVEPLKTSTARPEFARKFGKVFNLG